MLNLVQRASTTGSVLTPLIWICGALYTFTVALYATGAQTPGHIVLGLSILMTLFMAFYYNFWQRTDANRLH